MTVTKGSTPSTHCYRVICTLTVLVSFQQRLCYVEFLDSHDPVLGGEWWRYFRGSMSCAPVLPKRKHLRRKHDLRMSFKLVPPISSNHFKSLWKSICWGNVRSEIYLVNLNHLAIKYLHPTHSTLEQRGWGGNAPYLLIHMVHVYFPPTNLLQS